LPGPTNDAARLEETPSPSPGCLPSARCPTSRPSEALRVPCYVRAKVLAPLSPSSLVLSSSTSESPPDRASPPRLGLPRGSPRWCGQDASYQPLQPTHDTSTRGSLDFRIRSLRHGKPLDASPTEIGFFRAASNRRVWHGNSAPVGHALDGAAPALAVSHTKFRRAFDPTNLEHHRFSGGTTLTWLCRPRFRAGERPLTLPVALRIA
jgi:hypothetical protein